MKNTSINFLPRDPAHYRPKIGLIGCGAITKEHLTAYRTAGYDVAALCDIDQSAAEARRKEFFPEALVTNNIATLLALPEIEVVDIATHVAVRSPLVRAALEADKHVLSQKPFVLDLAEGQQLISVAEAHNRKLAVNQNGRWAPHFCFMRRAIAQGLIGQVQSVQMAVHWDHNWIAGTEFDGMKHVILFDFAIHWFDMLGCFLPGHTPLRVHASCVQAARQRAKPPLLGQASIEYETAQAQLFFNGNCTCGASDTTIIVGTEGTLISTGADLRKQQVTLHREGKIETPVLSGSWFPVGFHGTMGELLLAIEAEREPENSAVNNLQSLALCFAAVASAEQGRAVVPGSGHSNRRIHALTGSRGPCQGQGTCDRLGTGHPEDLPKTAQTMGDAKDTAEGKAPTAINGF